MDIPSTICRQLINDYSFFYPEMQGNIPTGCNTYKTSLSIPEYVSSGNNYYVRATYKYKITPFREIRYVVDSEMFSVIE
jgi:hypothetical protein